MLSSPGRTPRLRVARAPGCHPGENDSRFAEQIRATVFAWLSRPPSVLPLMDPLTRAAFLDSGGDLSRVNLGTSVGAGGRNGRFGSLTFPVG